MIERSIFKPMILVFSMCPVFLVPLLLLPSLFMELGEVQYDVLNQVSFNIPFMSSIDTLTMLLCHIFSVYWIGYNVHL